jgi:hypothetical protein
MSKFSAAFNRAAAAFLCAVLLHISVIDAVAQGAIMTGALKTQVGVPGAASGAVLNGYHAPNEAPLRDFPLTQIQTLPGVFSPLSTGLVGPDTAEAASEFTSNAILSAPELHQRLENEGRIALEQFRHYNLGQQRYAAPRDARLAALDGLKAAGKTIGGIKINRDVDSMVGAGREIFDSAQSRPRMTAAVKGETVFGRTAGKLQKNSGAKALKKAHGSIPAPRVARLAAIAAVLTPSKVFAAAGPSVAAAAKTSVFVSVLHAVPLAPLAYAFYKYRKDLKAVGRAESKSFARRLNETAEAGIGGILGLIGAGIATVAVSNPLIWAAAMAGSAFLTEVGMAESLSKLRSYVIGGWQASHDQKYRVGYDGRLHDVRGHKYGEDRYEAMAPGPVGPAARFVMRSAAAWIGLLWFAGSTAAALLVYNLVLTLLFLLEDFVLSRRGPPQNSPMDAEAAAFAGRFTKSD